MTKKQFQNCDVIKANIKDVSKIKKKAESDIKHANRLLRSNKKALKKYCGKNLKNNLWRHGR